MDAFLIEGGRKLKGSVRISGSKNAALPCLFASLLTDDVCVIENVPDLRDIRTAVALLQQLGKKVVRKNSRVEIGPARRLQHHASYDLVRRMRASVVVMGPLLARLGKARVSLPGGCSIGARPINFHLQAFKKLGAAIRVEEGYVEATAPVLRGRRIRFPFPSVGATENALMAAVLAEGKTVLLNAAREPEIQDLAECLRSMGARIHGHGTGTIVIDGVPSLHGTRHVVIPDRIEAGTFLAAAAITRGRLLLRRVNPAHLSAVLNALRRAGLRLEVGRSEILAAWTKPLRPVSLKTRVYPGFPTDMQAQWMALMATVNGKSRITETIFENRFLHAQELLRMGAAIDIRGAAAVIEGGRRLSGCPLMVSDLRAGAALVLAGLAAQGRTKVLRVYHLDRGYERMERKLRAVGARIRRIAQ
ncbi:MAG TPA: UDP-N-acetylglucosamine 1-carboxyvinyltransferase [Elusimicrobiota bacterium]|nr:UDP-N-acetylglucosamine 1-carboxyvinyltransferase [Elusimicrobiota bacterium]